MDEIKYTNYSMTFDKKGYGRIFVEKETDIQQLKDIMKEIDEEEFNVYYPSGNYAGSKGELITVFSPENYFSVYVGKFSDMDMSKVMKIAWERGIKCFCVFGKCNMFDGE